MEGYYLVDLRKDDVDQIKQDKKAALAELLLKQGGISNNFHERLDSHESLLSDFSSVYDEEVYLYISTIDTRRSALSRIDRIKDPTQRQLAMTIAQQLRREGSMPKHFRYSQKYAFQASFRHTYRGVARALA